MAKKTLIVYVTKGGVTKEYAEIIADELRKKKHTVELTNIKQVGKLGISCFDNIIVGAGVRVGRVYKPALRFLENSFAGKQLAIYLSSAEAGNPLHHNHTIEKHLGPVLARMSPEKPVDIEAFGGKISVFGKIIMDNREPERVKSWAAELAKKLK
ncbi:MAG: hypothetical protein GOU99_03855 [Candidatus Altiarchaeota archaeon]|nr:hypothetical protein [Candidatus Altiarchaeota archaeon]